MRDILVWMAATLDGVLLHFCAEKLAQLTFRIGDCLGRLTEEQIWARARDNENAVGNLVLHLSGNVRQWIVSGIGGAPDTRERAREFATSGGPAAPQLDEQLRATVGEAIAILQSLGPDRLLERIRVQDYDVTVLEAVLHVTEHFAEHTGQIIFATKAATGEDLGYYRHLTKTAAHKKKIP